MTNNYGKILNAAVEGILIQTKRSLLICLHQTGIIYQLSPNTTKECGEGEANYNILLLILKRV